MALYKKLMDETLLFIAQKGWAMKEQEFYDSLALFLAKNLDMSYVIIDKLDESDNSVETLSFVTHGEVNKNVTYSLEGTPCENVIGKNLCCYKKNVQELFPDDTMLFDMSAESYIGIPLWASNGNPLGLIALLNTKPIENTEEITTILQIVAVRVAHEIERNNYELKLLAKNEILHIKNEELDQFVYSISHQLRSPLVSILGLVNVAAKEKPNKTQKQYLDLIKKSIFRLDDSIKEINDLVKNTRLDISNDQIDFNELLDEILQNINHFDSNIGIDISKKIDQNCEFKTDRSRLILVLSNLVSNALKYFDPGKKDPKLNIIITVDERGCVINFNDNGIGIQKDQLENIFNMFYRASSRSYGSGLGLYIVKETLEKLKGKVNVESEEGKYSKFTVTIPHAIT